MASLSDWFENTLASGAVAPLSRTELIQEFGGGRKGAPALARRLVGLPAAGRLPSKGTAERKRYDSTLRAVERGEARGINPKTGRLRQARPGTSRTGEIQEIGRQARIARAQQKMDKLRKSGGRVRVRADVSVRGQRGRGYSKERDFDVRISAEDWDGIAEIAATGDATRAAEELELLLLDARGLAGIGGEIDGVISGTIT